MSDHIDLSAISTQDLAASLSHIVPSELTFHNWAQTFSCRPERVFSPKTVDECRRIVEYARRERARLHPVGVGHSPSDLACTNGWLIKMEGIKGMLNVRRPFLLKLTIQGGSRKVYSDISIRDRPPRHSLVSCTALAPSCNAQHRLDL